MKEESSSPAQGAQAQAPAMEEKDEDWDAVGDNPVEDDDNIDDEILNAGGQLTPIDDLASPEDSYDLGYEFTDEQAERMLLSPPRPPDKDFTFTKPIMDVRPPP